MHIVVVPGSNRAGARSRQLAGIVAGHYRDLPDISVDMLALDLPSECLAADVYTAPAPGVTALVQRFLAADGVVFVVPEYNGSFPGVLKLFIDLLPYPAGFDRRPLAFIGLAAGQFQGLRAVEHLQGVTGYRNAHHFPPRVFIGGAATAFDGDGALVDGKLAERLRQQATGFVRFVQQIKAG